MQSCYLSCMQSIIRMQFLLNLLLQHLRKPFPVKPLLNFINILRAAFWQFSCKKNYKAVLQFGLSFKNTFTQKSAGKMLVKLTHYWTSSTTPKRTGKSNRSCDKLISFHVLSRQTRLDGFSLSVIFFQNSIIIILFFLTCPIRQTAQNHYRFWSCSVHVYFS
jgi:hypothetical protein